MPTTSLTKADRIDIVKHGFIIYIAIVMLVIGSPIFIYFGGFSGLNDIKFWLLPSVKTYGYITDIEETDLIDDGDMVFRYHYSFPVEKNTHYGFSYSKYFEAAIEDEVPIYYVKMNPDISKIEGTTYNKNFWVYIGLLIVLGAFVILIVVYNKGRKTFFILKDGTSVMAIQESVEKTDIEINDQPRYRVRYEYLVEKRPFHATIYTSDPEGLEESAPLVYSNQDAHQYMWLEDLPDAYSERFLPAS